ncbi:MAG: 2Fe-2S iron-sulfur cluster-binding protein [Cytophagales bacterium]
MPDILIKNLFNRKVPFYPSNNSVMHAIHAEFIDWMHTCGGKGRCTTCKLTLIKGTENVSSLSGAELKYRNKNLLKENQRLACQCKISGDIEIEVSPENKLPHMKYSY